MNLTINLFIFLLIQSFVVFNYYNTRCASGITDPTELSSLENITYCYDLKSSFYSTVIYTLRVASIFEIIQNPKYNVNQPFSSPQNMEYLTFTFLSLFFFIAINMIYLNILLGIVFDSFKVVRQSKQMNLDQTHNVCFTCGLTKAHFEITNQNWFKHLYVEHNVYDYLGYYLRLRKEPVHELDGIT